MKTTILLAVCAFLAAGGAAARNAVDLTEWKFRYCGGCDPDTPVKEPKDCFKAAYDDAQWRVVQAPHDWGVEGVFDRKYGCWVGGLPCFGVGWYRTRFKTTAAMAAGRASLEFDGVMSDSKVYVNGACVGGRPFGYASFSFDVTALLAPEGTENVIAVRVDNALWGARWYPGGGLYRPVRIVTTGRTRIAWNGVWVKPSVKRGDTARHARCIGVLDVEVALDGDAEGCEVRKRILGEKGLCVESPRLWDVTAPNLYTARVEVVRAGRVIDACDTVFGFRTAEFRPKEGFFLNGRHLKINGVCLHHDLGPLGAAVDRGSIRRQLRIMREMGANAVRTSHNPPARELLEECDRMGIMVLDEIFDEWRSPKMLMGYSRFFADWWERDLVDWIRRDRNHPCVIAWSVGNEVEEQKTPHAGRELGARLAAVAHREDPFRPVTMGCDSTAVFTNGMMEAMDIYGANYRPDFYKELLERFPGKGVLGTETASMVSSRDTYFYPLPDGFEKRPRPFRKGYLDRQVSSYDIFPQRPHNYHPDVEFFRQDTLPQVYGEFIWTGFDYLGEPAPHPSSRSSYYGAVDLCGFPKDRYYAYQAQWRPEHAMVHLLPHWTWHGREGQRTPVWVYTSGDEAELFVNGKSCGFRKKDKANGVYTLEWNDVSYEPGEIRVVAYRNGRKWAEVCRRTAGRAFGLRVTAEQGAADDAFVYYRIALVDSQGTVVPCEDRELVLSVEGDGELAGACNGDATDMTAFRSPRQRTFRGLMLAVVRRVPGKTHRLCVEGESLPRTLCPSNFTLDGAPVDRDFVDFDKYRDYLEPLGVSKIRILAGWAKSEREKGKVDVAWLDRIVDWCLAHGIEPLLELSYGNPIYPGAGGAGLSDGIPNTPEGLREWDRWVDFLANHYKGRVKEWAMWNEPDNRIRVNTPDMIAAFNVRSAKILKKHMPDCRLHGLSLGSSSAERLELCLRPMGEDVKLFDTFIYHGYVANPDLSYETDAARNRDSNYGGVLALYRQAYLFLSHAEARRTQRPCDDASHPLSPMRHVGLEASAWDAGRRFPSQFRPRCGIAACGTCRPRRAALDMQ